MCVAGVGGGAYAASSVYLLGERTGQGGAIPEHLIVYLTVCV